MESFDSASQPLNSTSPSLAAARLLQQGMAIPAHPLALDANRRLDERRQRALSRYYLAAGAGGLAVGVHTTQFRIHDPEVGLLRPVLELAAEELERTEAATGKQFVRVAGICGDTNQAVQEAHLARDVGYHFGLLNLGGMKGATTPVLLDHIRAVAETIGVFGFYLQPAVGGVELPYEFWRKFCEIENVVAIKVAAFNRYHTLEVLRAVVDSGRQDISLYTGNDDNIICDLITPYTFPTGQGEVTRHFIGGLLGQWAVWTRQAVELLDQCREYSLGKRDCGTELLRLSAQLTDANSAIFDAANEFRGCLPGIHEVLRRQGLLAGGWCLDENEVLSPGQAAEIDRVMTAYPHLQDNEFVEAHREEWLSG